MKIWSHIGSNLIRQLASDFRSWVKLEPTGILGSDEGYDARGIEFVDGEERLWQIQSKREQSIAPKKMSAYIQDMIPKGATVPYGVILAAPANFSKKTRDAFAQELGRKGVHEFYLWGKADIEDFLYQPKNNHLLYAFFESRCKVNGPASFS